MSQNERNLDCEITFQTHSILQRFMLRYFHTPFDIPRMSITSLSALRFDTLSLDCNDHLYVYDGGHAAGQPKVNSGDHFINNSFEFFMFIFSDGYLMSKYKAIGGRSVHKHKSYHAEICHR